MFLIIAAALATQVSGPSAVVELDEMEETQMALNAAPEHLRDGAGVYLLSSGTYRESRRSKNGFNCLVAREPSLGLAPVCYDAEGSRTNMQADIFRGELRRRGTSEADVETAVRRAYADGRLKAPARPGIAYMLSNHFSEVDSKTGKRQCVFPPHVMFYAPYLKNEDIGATPKHFGSTQHPWILNEGAPGAHILVVGHGVETSACH